ncbi:MAG: nucleoside hydrolase [Bacteroidales bacterium]|nr:nucleoside hydrolase [Bacteroidales bacterium]
MKRFLPSLTLAVALAASCAQPKAPQTDRLQVIFETDLGNDVDDALALDLLYKYQDQGLIDILAIMINKNGTAPAEYADIMNTWYGHQVPIGIIFNGAECENDGVNYAKVVAEMRNDAGEPVFERSGIDLSTLPEAHILYRELLAGAADKSVNIVSVGFSTNLSRLLDSPADEISSLTGRELVAAKVAMLYTMAAHMTDTTFREYNVVKDVAAAKNVFENWPTPITNSSFEVGAEILYPATSIENDFGWAPQHPLVEAYKSYLPMPHDRPCWDPTALLYAVEGERFFGLSEPGSLRVNPDGSVVYEPSEDGTFRYITVTDEQRAAIKQHFVEMITSVPAKYRK